MTSSERTLSGPVRNAPAYAPIPMKRAWPNDRSPAYPKRRLSPSRTTAYAMNGSMSSTW